MFFAEKEGGKGMKAFIVILIILVIFGVILGVAFCGKEGLFNKSVTVTLVTNGGEVSVRTLVGKAGDPMELPTPTREGYTFDKWYNDFDIVDQTVFPSENMTLTARYYADKDEDFSFSSSTELNKSYKADTSGSVLSWKKEDLSKENLELHNYIVRNYNEEIVLSIEFEEKINGAKVAAWLGGCGGFYFRAAHELDSVIKYNFDDWETVQFTVKAKGSELVNEGSGFVRLYWDTNVGSTDVLVRNLKFTISGTIKAGTLV